MATVNCYVDGLNLYKRRLEGTAKRWLDLRATLEAEFPNHEIRRIRYFTALIKPSSDQGPNALRQKIYLAALKATDGLTIHHGQIRTDPAVMRAMWPKLIGSETVEVWDEHEKGSDVSLASYVFADFVRDDWLQEAIVITHDSDQANPIRLAREVFNKPIGVLDPSQSRSKDLQSAADYYHRMTRFRELPPTVTTKSGRTVSRPAEWS